MILIMLTAILTGTLVLAVILTALLCWCWQHRHSAAERWR